eukprot:EG_transcript_10936
MAATPDWHPTQYGEDWYSEQFPEARPPPPPAPAPELLPPRRPASARWVKAAQRWVLSGLQCGGLFGAKAVVWAFRAAQQICRLRIVQQLFTLLLVVMAAFGLYSYWQHTVDTQLGGKLNPAQSCQSLHTALSHLKTGVYWLDPKGALLASKRPFQAYCDMATDGGGWTLVLAYAREPARDADLDASHWPLDPLGYSHAFHWTAHDLHVQFATEAWFYCHSAAHPRKVHFKVQHPGILRAVMANGGYACLTEDWRDRAQPLDGHTAHLPQEADSCWNGVLHHPFFKGHRFHWNIRFQPQGADAFRWECDDLSGGDAATVHQIWVR